MQEKLQFVFECANKQPLTVQERDYVNLQRLRLQRLTSLQEIYHCFDIAVLQLIEFFRQLYVKSSHICSGANLARSSRFILVI